MKQYKPRDKVTQKITREGAVEENQTTGKSENISGKEKEADFSGRLHFTEEDRAMPELDRYIRKAEQAADKAEAAILQNRTPYLCGISLRFSLWCR